MCSETCTPKTVIGNKIDPSLARGIVRSILRVVRIQSEQAKRSLGKGRFYSNPKARLRTLSALAKAMGSNKIAIVASDKSYLQAKILTYIPYEDLGSEHLVVSSAIIDFRKESDYPNEIWEEWPLKDFVIFGKISQHSLERIVQRTGSKSMKDIQEILYPIWLWADVAAAIGNEEPKWLLPTETGIFSLSSEADQKGNITTHVITYIDNSDISEANKKIWTELVEEGAIYLRPGSFAAKSRSVSPEQTHCFWNMCALGRLQLFKEDLKSKGTNLKNHLEKLSQSSD